MNKHKKTRQEKVISDLRKKLASQKDPQPVNLQSPVNKIAETNKLNQTATYTLPTVQPVRIPQSFSKTQISFDYSYVFKDLRKTIFLTIIIVGIEFFIYSVWH